MTDETIDPDEITEEASDPLGAPDSQEEEDDNWSPDELSAEDRAHYDKAVAAVDAFLANHPTYKPTDENKQTILDYLADHDLLISPASLELAWEQLRQRLDLAESQKPDSKDQALSESARVRQASTARLARRTSDVESEASEDQSQEPAPPQKKPTAWRNGKEIQVGGLNVGKRAVFKDQHGHAYSAPVMLNDGQWVMVTSEGFAPITQFFDDDFAGRLEFVEYRDEPEEPLHIEAKQPGQSSLQQLQSAYAKTEAKARADRNRNMQEQVRQSNELDARRIQGARDNNNLLAHRWSRQRPDPVPPQIPPKEVMAEAGRFRKRTEQK